MAELVHTCDRISDPEASVRFYEALGFEKRRELPVRAEAKEEAPIESLRREAPRAENTLLARFDSLLPA